MITLITGVPGSGKTYYAVNRIFDIFNSSSTHKDKSKFKFCYTNINEFAFSDQLQGVLPLDMVKIQNDIKTLYELYKKQSDDTELNALADQLGIYSCLFVIDEAQNFGFDKVNASMLWWLTYHRHLNHEIILITQNVALIDSKAKKLPEEFYKAIPSSLRLLKNRFRYSKYVSANMYNKEKVGDFSIPFNKEVYSLYHSGGNTQSSNVFKRFFFIFLGFLALVIIIFYLIKKILFTPDQPPKKEETKKEQVIKPSQVASSHSDKIEKIISLICDRSYCFSGDVLVTERIFTQIMQENDFEVLQVLTLNQYHKQIFYSIPKDFDLSLIKGAKNVQTTSKGGNDDSSFLPDFKFF